MILDEIGEKQYSRNNWVKNYEELKKILYAQFEEDKKSPPPGFSRIPAHQSEKNIKTRDKYQFIVNIHHQQFNFNEKASQWHMYFSQRILNPEEFQWVEDCKNQSMESSSISVHQQ